MERYEKYLKRIFKMISGDVTDDEFEGLEDYEWLKSLYISVLYHLASTLDSPPSEVCKHSLELCVEVLDELGKEGIDEKVGLAIVITASRALTSWYLMPLVVENYEVKKIYLRNMFYPIEMVVSKGKIEEFKAVGPFEKMFKEKVFVGDRSLLEVLEENLGDSFFNDVNKIMNSSFLLMTMKDLKVEKRDGLAVLDAEFTFGLGRVERILEKALRPLREKARRILGDKYSAYEELIERYLDKMGERVREMVKEILKELEGAGEGCLLMEGDLTGLLENPEHAEFIEEFLEGWEPSPLDYEDLLEELEEVRLVCFEEPLREASLRELRKKGLTGVMRTTGET